MVVGPDQKPTKSSAARLYNKLAVASRLSEQNRYKLNSPISGADWSNMLGGENAPLHNERPLNVADRYAAHRFHLLVKSNRKKFKVSQMNGSHGEYTESDDVKKNGARKVPPNPPQRKKKSGQTRRRVVTPIPRVPSDTMLSKCAAKFLLAQTAPFSADALGACVPSIPARNTFRASAMVRGTVATGTNGTGILFVTPCIGNDGVFVTATQPLFSGVADTYSILAASDIFQGGGISKWSITTPNTLPYTSAQLYSGHGQGAQNVFGRVVGGGIRLRPMSAPLYRQGVHFAMTDPSHQNFTAAANGMGFNIKSSPYSRVFTSEDSIEIPFGPTDGPEMNFPMEESGFIAVQTDTMYPLSLGRTEYATAGYNWTYNAQKVGQPIIGILFTGGSLTNSTVFEYEAIIHVEYAGPVADSFGIPTEPDPVGTTKVLNAMSQVQRRAQITTKPTGNGGGSAKEPSLTKIALAAIKTAAIEVAPHALSYLAKSLPALLL